MARSSVSLLPASESAGLPVEAGRAGGSSETAAGAATGASGEVDAGDVVRGRVVEATFFAGCDLCVVVWDAVSRDKSSRMFRAASHPDKSNKLTPTVCLIRILIVIPPT
jgi:hypothetical protein